MAIVFLISTCSNSDKISNNNNTKELSQKNSANEQKQWKTGGWGNWGIDFPWSRAPQYNSVVLSVLSLELWENTVLEMFYSPSAGRFTVSS